MLSDAGTSHATLSSILPLLSGVPLVLLVLIVILTSSINFPLRQERDTVSQRLAELQQTLDRGMKEVDATQAELGQLADKARLVCFVKDLGGIRMIDVGSAGMIIEPGFSERGGASVSFS